MRRVVVLVSLGLLACSSSSSEPAGSTSAAAAASTTGAGQGGGATTTTSVTTTTSASTGAGGAGQGGAAAGGAGTGEGGAGGAGTGEGGAGGAGPACVGDPGSFYAQTDISYDIDILDPVPMCIYRGEVILVVNTAALCGFTPQYAPLEALQKSYAGQGFEVVGFFSNDFGSQAGDGAQIAGCTQKYGVTFTEYGIDHVTDQPSSGSPATPRAVYSWLGAQAAQAPANTKYPTWNFHKYLLSRDGKLVAHWPSEVDPTSPEITAAIEAEIAKPAP